MGHLLLSSFKSSLIGHWKANHSSDFSLLKRTASQPAGKTDLVMEVAPPPKITESSL